MQGKEKSEGAKLIYDLIDEMGGTVLDTPEKVREYERNRYDEENDTWDTEGLV